MKEVLNHNFEFRVQRSCVVNEENEEDVRRHEESMCQFKETCSVFTHQYRGCKQRVQLRIKLRVVTTN
jgi:hypothetical protein